MAWTTTDNDVKHLYKTKTMRRSVLITYGMKMCVKLIYRAVTPDVTACSYVPIKGLPYLSPCGQRGVIGEILPI